MQQQNDGSARQPNFHSVNVLGVPVASITVAQFSDWLLNRIERRTEPADSRVLFVTYLNAACSNIAAYDAEYREILDQADCVYADGQAIVWAAKALKSPLPERVNAGDFITDFCRELARRNTKLALIGGRPGVATQAAAQWTKAAPGLQVVCALDGFFSDDGATAATAVKAAAADIVLIGMGVPLQEKWAWPRRHNFGAKAIWCVGALFEYYGENRPRAPIWMRRTGLEWLFRLTLEPRRLWRRYLIGNLRFIHRTWQHRQKQHKK